MTQSGLWPASLADQPYSEADAEEYQRRGGPGPDVLPSPGKLLKAQLETVRPGGRVAQIHYLWARPPSIKQGKKRVVAIRDHMERVCKIRLVACIGVIVGYANRMRVYSVFERELPKTELAVPQVHTVRPGCVGIR